MSSARSTRNGLVVPMIALLVVSACSRQPQASSAQPDTVVTNRSGGAAIPNPRAGSFQRSTGGTWGYTAPPGTEQRPQNGGNDHETGVSSSLGSGHHQ